MYYKIETKKIKKIINNSLTTLDIPKENTPDSYNLKEVDKLSLEQIKNFNRNEANPSFESATLLAKEISSNLGIQDSFINLVENNGKTVFKDWKSLGQYIGLLLSEKEYCIVESNYPIYKYAEEISSIEARNSINQYQPLVWSIPDNLLSESWDDPEYAIKELSKCYDQVAQDYIKKIPKHLFSDKSFMEKFLTLKAFSSHINSLEDTNFLDKKIYLEILIENPKAFLVQLDGSLGTTLNSIAKEISDECSRRGIKNHPTSEFTYISILDSESENFPEYKTEWLKDVKYLVDNLFSDSTKMKSILLEKSKGVSKLDFSDSEEIATLCSKEVQMDEDFIKLLKEAFDNSKRDFYRKSLISVIPPEYFSDKNKTTKLLEEALISDDENSKSMFPSYVTELYKDDIESITKFVDMALDYKGVQFADQVLCIFRSIATPETLKSKEFFKRLVKLNSFGFKHFQDDKECASVYKEYITKDKEMMLYIEENADPKSMGYLPDLFLRQISNRDIIKKIIKETYGFVDYDSRIPEWRKDVEFLAASGRNITSLSLKKSELSEIIKTKEDAILLIEANAEIYPKLPAQYKKDKDISLYAVQMEWDNINEVDAGLFMNKIFCYELCKANSDFARIIPKAHFYNEDFIVNLFKGIDNNEIVPRIITKLPQEINKCVEAFNLEVGSYESFAKSFFGNQKLSNSLTTENKEPKKKMKI